MARKRSPKKRYRALKNFLIFQLILILLVVGAVTFYYVGGYGKIISHLRNEAVQFVTSSNESTFRQIETSIAYDAKGNVLSVFKGEKDVYYLDYEDIPVNVKEAIISIEDKKFYDHRGVDYRAVIRALWAMIRNGRVTQGASTITQQLARGIFLTQDRTWERKIEEMFIANELEKRYSKNRILEFYLNNIYFANGLYGIEAASQGYFNKSCKDLTLSQAAFLCAIPNSPTMYDPIEHMSDTLSRRDLILRNMYDDGIISLEEYQKALDEKIQLVKKKKEKHNYQETYLIYCATRSIMQMEGFEFRNEFISDEDEKEYRESYEQMYNECNFKLFRGGYRIYTSLDSDMQKLLQSALDSELASNDEVGENGIYALQGSSVCIDNDTGFVRAIVGGRSQEYEGYTLNRAFQSFRQPGSAIKPLIVYTPALERGYTPDSILVDEPIPDGPENSGGGYSGRITLRNAVERSKNTIAWKLFQEITPAVGLSYLKAMGFSSIGAADNVPAAALGGFSRGVSALEMAAGFSTLENIGYYGEPTCITRITDSRGNTVFQPSAERSAVYTEAASIAMTDILEGVFTSPGGTARGLGLNGMHCAGKTGTTNDNKDGWFVGYTPYYTTAVWVGFDTPREMPGLWGSTLPGRIWHNFMTDIHTGFEDKDFRRVTTAEDMLEEPPEEIEEFEELEEIIEYDIEEETWPDEEFPEETDDRDQDLVPVIPINPQQTSPDQQDNTYPPTNIQNGTENTTEAEGDDFDTENDTYEEPVQEGNFIVIG